MNPGRYFFPNMGRPFMNVSPIMNSNYFAPRGLGLFNRTLNGIKSINWKGLINGASKTLNTVNQTIPLIRQAKPVIGNVKSMVKLVRAFGGETNNNSHKLIKSNNSNIINNSLNNNRNDYPTFFI